MVPYARIGMRICISCFSPVSELLHAPSARAHMREVSFSFVLNLVSRVKMPPCVDGGPEPLEFDSWTFPTGSGSSESTTRLVASVLDCSLRPEHEGETPHRRTDSTPAMLIPFPSILPSPAARTAESWIAVLSPERRVVKEFLL